MNPQPAKNDDQSLQKIDNKNGIPPLYVEELKSKENTELAKIKIIKTIVFIAMISVTIVYLVFASKQVVQGECIFDRVHSLTTFANNLLHTNSTFRFWMILIGQQFIDIASVSLLVLYFFRIRTFWPAAWLLSFYVFRAFLLNLTKMPYPNGYIFEGPGIPSFAVPYGVARDFFYSGHTGFMVFCCSVWSLTPSKFMKYFLIIGTIQVIAMLLITRVHYSIDIFAGFLFSRWFTMILTRNALSIDKFFSFVIQTITQSIMKLYLCIASKIVINRQS